MRYEPTVFVVEADPLARQEALQTAAEAGFPAEPFSSVEQYLIEVPDDRPGCILLGLMPPLFSGSELFAALGRRAYHPPVIATAVRPDISAAVTLMRAGAINVLEKSGPRAHLRQAICEAMLRDAVERRRLATEARLARRLARLTEGERRVLDLLIAGGSNKSIALELGLSVRAVEVRRSKIMRKMKADSLAELVCMSLALKSDDAPQLAATGVVPIQPAQ